jgi:catechol 2,3-dioxygenase-like lactoylglutathione lyase family enzyme
MPYRSVSHVALRVPDLRQAEDFYMTLFDLEVASGRPTSPMGGEPCPRVPGGRTPRPPVSAWT